MTEIVNSQSVAGKRQSGYMSLIPKRIKQMVRAVLNGPGRSEPVLRQAVFELTRTGAAASQTQGTVPSELRELVQMIDQRPWRVSDENLARLRQVGYSEDQIFEMIVAAAAGAGMRRLEAALRAIEAAGDQLPCHPAAVRCSQHRDQR